MEVRTSRSNVVNLSFDANAIGLLTMLNQCLKATGGIWREALYM